MPSRKKSKGGAHSSLFDAQEADDALAAFTIPAEASPLEPPARQGSRSGRWGVLIRKDSATKGRGAASSGAGNAATEAECARQGEELQRLRGELAAARAAEQHAAESLNLQRFKFELLVDLWSMRILDNEELGVAAAQ